MSTKTDKHDIQGLLAELQAAEEQFNIDTATVGEASNFHTYHQARLNELEYGKQLEYVGDHQTRIDEVIRNQERRRCSYESGRMALQLAYSRLSRDHHGRDKLVRTIMKLVATVKCVRDGDDSDLIARSCLETANRSNYRFDLVWEKDWRESLQDLTAGAGKESLAKAYTRLLSQGVSGQEAYDSTATELSMILIAVQDTELDEARHAFQLGTEENDNLVKLGLAAQKMLQGADFVSAREAYKSDKAALDELQYTGCLQAALAAGNRSAAENIKSNQRTLRIEYLRSRQWLKEVLRKLKDMAAEMSAPIEALKPLIKANEQAFQMYALVAINNIVAAEAIRHSVRLVTRTWEKELDDSEETHKRCQVSLQDELNGIVRLLPYNASRWLCYGPGSYTEPR